MKAVSLRLGDDQYEQLRRTAAASCRPLSQVILDAVEEHLARRATPGQEWFWSDGWQQAEREAEADLSEGRVESYCGDQDFLASLN